MKLYEILSEDAVAGSTSAHSIAGARDSLFGGPIKPTQLKRMIPPGGSVVELDLKKRKTVAGIPVIKFNQER